MNGTPVTYEQYQAAYRNLYEQVSRSQEEPISSAQNREIEEAAWTEIVNQILIQQELGRRGIRVTDQEIRDAPGSVRPRTSGRIPSSRPTASSISRSTRTSWRTPPTSSSSSSSKPTTGTSSRGASFSGRSPRGSTSPMPSSGSSTSFDNEQARVRFVAFNPD